MKVTPPILDALAGISAAGIPVEISEEEYVPALRWIVDHKLYAAIRVNRTHYDLVNEGKPLARLTSKFTVTVFLETEEDATLFKLFIVGN